MGFFTTRQNLRFARAMEFSTTGFSASCWDSHAETHPSSNFLSAVLWSASMYLPPDVQSQLGLCIGPPASALSAPPSLQTSAMVNQGAGDLPFIIDPHLRMPYSQSWNFGVQRDLPGSVGKLIRFPPRRKLFTNLGSITEVSYKDAFCLRCECAGGAKARKEIGVIEVRDPGTD